MRGESPLINCLQLPDISLFFLSKRYIIIYSAPLLKGFNRHQFMREPNIDFHSSSSPVFEWQISLRASMYYNRWGPGMRRGKGEGDARAWHMYSIVVNGARWFVSAYHTDAYLYWQSEVTTSIARLDPRDADKGVGISAHVSQNMKSLTPRTLPDWSCFY